MTLFVVFDEVCECIDAVFSSGILASEYVDSTEEPSNYSILTFVVDKNFIGSDDDYPEGDI